MVPAQTILDGIWSRITGEPTMVLALVQAVIVLGISFGLSLTVEQTAAILAITAVVLGLITRSVVTPVGSPALPVGTVVEVIQPGATPNTTDTFR